MIVWELIRAGLWSVWDYVALHVITCLVPAFMLAGAMVSFVSQQAIMHYLGAAARKLKAFALAAGGSFFIAACSCTVIPVSSGLYYSGAAIGAAFIVLWVAPAANVLALVYTGSILGAKMMIVRIATALLMAFVVGWIMTLVFARQEQQRLRDVGAADDPSPATGQTRQPEAVIRRQDVFLLILLAVALLAPNYLVQSGPFWLKVVVWAMATALALAYAVKIKTKQELKHWMSETLWFVRLIFPLLLAGVFVVGVIGWLLPQQWVQKWLGGASLSAAFLATMIGSISYFATMTEAPFVHKLMELGMGPGPALALLLTGPGLSLPNWLAIGRVFGVKKAVVYVITIVILGTLTGWLAGQLVF